MQYSQQLQGYLYLCVISIFLIISEKKGKLKLNLITLVVIVITNNHIDKIVLNLGLKTWIKGQDELLA